jgi:hypothetical protein
MVNKMAFGEISFFTADSMPYGETYGSWTVKWWQWFLLTPKSINPGTGEYTYVNQQSNDILFLAGKLADEDRNFPNRFCTVSTKTSILFPVINCAATQSEYPKLEPQDLIGHVKRDEDTIIKKECFVNGKRIPAQRVKSDPLIFKLRINEDNAFNVKGGGSTASADGYWVFLKPLPIGEHIMSFQGCCEYGKLNSGANYHLQVVEQKDFMFGL